MKISYSQCATYAVRIGLCTLCLSYSAPAADQFWTNSAGGTFSATNNWFAHIVPGPADNADFTNDAGYTVIWTNDAAAANAFFNANSGTVTQSIGAFSWFLTNSYIIGRDVGSLPSVTHNSGNLRVTNSTSVALLEVRRGSSQLNSGVIETDQLLLTNLAGVFNFNGGTLITRAGTVSNILPFNVGAAGFTPAIWDVRAGTELTVFSNVVIGLNVAGCQTLLTNGGKLTSVAGFIGENAGANSALVSGPGSLWTINAAGTISNAAINANGSLVIGDSSSLNRLVISNGASVVNLRAASLGVGSGASSNLVWVTGAGSIWSNTPAGASVSIGRGGSFNQLLISNSGMVLASGGDIGVGAGSRSNSVIVTDTGSAWTVQNGNADELNIGRSGGFNQMVVSNGAEVFNTQGAIGFNAGASNNVVLVTGSGSVWSNRSSLFVGISAGFNQLVISNGGIVFNGKGTIGDSSAGNNNSVLVTGAASAWTNSSTLSVGSFGSSNQLLVLNGGTVSAPSLFVGVFSASLNNRSVVDGATLRVINPSASAPLDVRRGTNQLNHSGLIDANVLLLTNALGFFEFNGGTLNVRTSTVANAQIFFVGDGTNSATLDLAGNGLHSYADGLTIRSNASLVGNGIVSGFVTIQNGGTLAPGNSVGKIILSNSPSLQGALVMEISKSGSVLTNDQIQVIPPLTYGGSLAVIDLGLDPLDIGDRFPLFNAFSYAGGFSSITLPALSPGLAWTNKLLVDGSIAVIAAPPPDRFWTNSLGGIYQTAPNWLDSLVPGPQESANFTNNAGYTVFWTNDAAAANAFFDAGSGTVTQSVGAFSWLLTNSYILGRDLGALPSVTHNSGSLRVTNSASAGLLEVRRGTSSLNSGVIEADQFFLPNPSGLFEFNGGTLITRGGTVSNILPFNVGAAGFTPAIWDVRAGTELTVFSNVVIGLNVAGCQTLLTNGGKLTSVAGFIGENAGANNSSALVSGPGSLWTINAAGTISNAAINANGSLVIGDSSSLNRLVISNSGSVVNLRAASLGASSGATSNLVWVSGSGSIWSNTPAGATISIGKDGSFNQLVISNSGVVLASGGEIGLNASSSNNTVWVTDPGSIWTTKNGNVDQLNIGRSGSFNQLVISNAGTVSDSFGTLGNNAGANLNSVFVLGSGSVWSNRSSLNVGIGGSLNLLVVSNGAQVVNVQATIGNSSSANYNSVLVAGAGSLWTNGSTLFVGFNGSSNLLSVLNGGTVLAPAMTIGSQSTSTNNRSVVDSGTLRVTKPSATAALDIRRGTNQLNNSGVIEADVLLVTNAAGVFDFSGGTLHVRASTITNGQPFVVGDSTRTATLDLVGNGIHFYANGLVIRTNASLIGNGIISGVLTVQNGGTLAPGNSIGKIILSNSPSLLGAVVMEISKSGGILTNDQVQVTPPLTYGGSLTVTNIGPDTLALGDRYVLFSASSYSSVFSSLTLPRLGIGLGWTNKLNVDGSIQVIATAIRFSSLSLSGTNVIASGAGGPPNSNYTVLASTNLTLPLTNWVPLFTNQFDNSGNFTFTNVILPSLAQRFYMLRVP